MTTADNRGHRARLKGQARGCESRRARRGPNGEGGATSKQLTHPRGGLRGAWNGPQGRTGDERGRGEGTRLTHHRVRGPKAQKGPNPNERDSRRPTSASGRKPTYTTETNANTNPGNLPGCPQATSRVQLAANLKLGEGMPERLSVFFVFLTSSSPSRLLSSFCRARSWIPCAVPLLMLGSHWASSGFLPLLAVPSRFLRKSHYHFPIK